MTQRIAIYPGTFDPITLGHLDIITRGASLFDQLIIAVAASTRKKPLCTLAQRISLCQQALKDHENIRVIELSGLTVNFAKQHHANYLLRGLRAASDFDYELQIASMNKQMHEALESIFLAASPQYIGVSSSMIREIIACEGWASLKHFVPECVATHFLPK